MTSGEDVFCRRYGDRHNSPRFAARSASRRDGIAVYRVACGPLLFESQFALRGDEAVRAAGCLLIFGELWLLKAAFACRLFASRRCDHSSPSSVEHYFGQGGVVLILTLAPPAPVMHGMARVSAMSADTDLQTVHNRKLLP